MDGGATGTGIGQPVRRREDLRLLTGRGRYSDDLNLPGQAYAVMVRSPHAHALIRGIDTAAARAAPGVLAVLTAEDVRADGLNPLPNIANSHPADISIKNKDGSPTVRPEQAAIIGPEVCHVGEIVAAVVATSLAAAKDAAELVAVDYEVLPAVAHSLVAAGPDAPRARRDSPNIILDGEVGDPVGDRGGLCRGRACRPVRDLGAAHRRRADGAARRDRRIRSAGQTGRYTLHAGAGGAVSPRRDLAVVLGVPVEQARVVMHDIGGNFGTRGGFNPEFAIVCWAARRVGRPVKWTGDRSEYFSSDHQARDLAVTAELALDRDGRFSRDARLEPGQPGRLRARLRLPEQGGRDHVEHLPCAGRAFPRPRRADQHGADPPLSQLGPARGHVRHGAADRSGGAADRHRPHRIAPPQPRARIDDAVHEPVRHGLRQRRLSPGHGAGARTGRLAGLSGAAGRRRAERGKCRGIGVANYVDTATGAPRERAEITVKPLGDDSGEIEVVVGTVSQGQGHETSFAQLVTEWLGVPLDSVRLVTGDTDRVSVGGGAHSGRALRLASIVMLNASNIIIEKGLRIAGHLLEAAAPDLEFAEGSSASRAPTAPSACSRWRAPRETRADLPEDLRGPLKGEGDETVNIASFPYGCHVCEVEVDPETGDTEIVRYSAVDDCRARDQPDDRARPDPGRHRAGGRPGAVGADRL